MPAPAQSSTNVFGADLHQFLERYEAVYPEEVVHIEKPLRADWEITALAIKFEKAQRFPVLVCHNVIVDGWRAEVPLVTFLMASRLRLARTFGVEVRRPGCLLRAGKACKAGRLTRAGAGETGGKRRDHRCAPFSAPLHHRMDPAATSPKVSFSVSTAITVSTTRRSSVAGWPIATGHRLLGPSTHNAYNLRHEESSEDMPATYWIGHHPLRCRSRHPCGTGREPLRDGGRNARSATAPGSVRDFGR
jgi:hypothetical protein